MPFAQRLRVFAKIRSNLWKCPNSVFFPTGGRSSGVQVRGHQMAARGRRRVQEIESYTKCQEPACSERVW
jgi:hypothetical protein